MKGEGGTSPAPQLGRIGFTVTWAQIARTVEPGRGYHMGLPGTSLWFRV